MKPDLQSIGELDRLIHEPARMLIMALLAAVEEVDFVYLLSESKLTKGNLSSHLAKLEEAGYVTVTKGYRGKIPRTLCRLSPQGAAAFRRYRIALKQVAGNLA